MFGKKKLPPVTNILTWVECYSAFVSVLSSAYPQYVPEFMAYMAIIIKCHKQFEGLSWYKYDRAYRRQAATLKSLQWSKTDSTLFNMAFTGKAKKMLYCEFCFSNNHASNQCPESAYQNPMFTALSMQSFIQSPFAQQHNNMVQQAPAGMQRQTRPICGLFNSKRGCTYNRCRFFCIFV